MVLRVKDQYLQNKKKRNNGTTKQPESIRKRELLNIYISIITLMQID